MGAPPHLVVNADRRSPRAVDLDAAVVDIRIDAWLGFDTIRRMGFGQVVAARKHTLIIERGVSFAAFERNGTRTATAYASNIFAPERRYVVVRSPGT